MALPSDAVAVVTDTTAYLPPEIVRENDIHLVSLYVNWDDDSERESDMTDYNAFYDRLRGGDRLPTTSQPSIGDFLDVYRPLLEAGRDIVSIHISGSISGTVESARQAKEQLGEDAGRVAVIDSRSGCGGQGLVVLAAAKAALSGADPAEVERRAGAAMADFKMWFAVETLEYLRRGGRIGAASAWLGMALKMKPILTFDGEIRPVERVRTSARAVRRLTEYAEERARDGADGWVVQHVQAPREAQQLIDATEEIMGKPPLFVSEIGPVIGVHVGPGLLGVGGLPLSHLA
jgi:DegV family protein with EDD domain